jgi:hypothetical protein
LVNGSDPVPRLPPSSSREWLWLVFVVIPVNLGFFIPQILCAGSSKENLPVPELKLQRKPLPSTAARYSVRGNHVRKSNGYLLGGGDV